MHVGPGENFHASVVVLNKGGATFDPVAIVAVENSVDFFDSGMVDVAADHAVRAASFGKGNHAGLVICHKLQDVFDLVFEVGRERPVREAELTAEDVVPVVQGEGGDVSVVAEYGKPARIQHDAIALIAMHNQITSAVCSCVNEVLAHFHPAKFIVNIITGKLIVVARHKEHLGSLAGAA